MKGFWTLEAIFVVFLLPLLMFVVSTESLIIPRETAELTHDLAQLYMYGHHPAGLPELDGKYTVWINGDQLFSCNYVFKYCTERLVKGEVVSICAAACST